MFVKLGDSFQFVDSYLRSQALDKQSRYALEQLFEMPIVVRLKQWKRIIIIVI